jgi:hypothetical protein
MSRGYIYILCSARDAGGGQQTPLFSLPFASLAMTMVMTDSPLSTLRLP